MLINLGLVGPKSNPKGEIDGYAVNIPQLAFIARGGRSRDPVAC